MPVYRYTALSQEGRKVSGTIDAPADDAVIAQLRRGALLPISVSAVRPWSDWLLLKHRPHRRGTRAQLAHAIRELATLLEAGLPLDRALTMLCELDDLRALSRNLVELRDRVRGGAGLADAMLADPLFPRMAVSMVRAGEMGGSLHDSLARLADYGERAQGVRDAVGAALVYPAILTVIGTASVFLMVMFVLPQFGPLFENAGTEPPLVLTVLLTLRDMVAAGWWVALLAMLSVALGLRRAPPELRVKWDAALLRMPVLGRIAVLVQMEQFARGLGALLANGVELPTALKVTRDGVTNRAMATALGEVAIGLREGEALADRLAVSGIFPALTLDFIRVGEETGRLDAMLLRLADMCERSLRHQLERLLAMLVPGLTVLFGFLVAGLVGSIITAILAANDLAI